MRTTRVAVGIATATVLLSISAAHATSRSAPTLGLKSSMPNGAGFGQVRPQRVDFGGDPTSFVTSVKWSSWGGARAVGHGKALWVWPGWCVACGGVELPATVVAFGRTTCAGHSAYSYVEWFFPSRGQSFNRRLAGENICSGKQVPIGSGKVLKCGQVRLRSALAVDISVFESPINCATARQFVAHSGAGRYLHRNARFTVDGWWCGSELSMDFGGLQPVACQRGDFTNVNFELKRG
ncbi:MAG TPA: hypothetical protein VFH80_21395 [Solirubrobacteraceae bacterium]|nr:hypothetical protein [Solirubrobacteraceae bacterium]